MGGSKLDKLKALQKEGKKGIVVDKTFGLKNKNKSKKVQNFCKQVNDTADRNKGVDAASKKKKKMSKLAKLQQEMELKALFSEGLSITVKKKDLHKKKGAAGGGGGGGAGDFYDENWAESELAKAQQGNTELTLEQRIEKKRQEFRDKGIKGTPVTPETFKAWKERKAKRVMDAKMALAKAEALKKKGKSVLTGRDLYLVQKDVFVDDADAEAAYVREAIVEEEGDGVYDENGALLAEVARVEESRAAPVSVDGVRVDAALYADGDDLDDLDDLDDT
jgi:hypothetical protein